MWIEFSSSNKENDKEGSEIPEQSVDEHYVLPKGVFHH